MRKFITIGVIAAVMLTASVAVIFAQSNGDTTPQAAASPSAWLGVAVTENNNQVVIARVQAGSPADTANLQIGDVITTFNGTAIASANDLRSAVQAGKPGDTVTVEVQRNGQPMSISVTLGSSINGGRGGDNAGLRTADALDMLFSAERLVHADLESATGGYQVVQVAADLNPFTLQVGDVLNTLNGQDISQLDPRTLMQSLVTDNGALSLVVTRGGQSVTLTSSLTDGLGFGFGRGGDDGPGGMMPGGRGGFGGPNGQNGQGNQQNGNPPAAGGNA
jgi:S1-C subfamily serine protease